MAFKQSTTGVLECAVRNGFNEIYDTLFQLFRGHCLFELFISSRSCICSSRYLFFLLGFLLLSWFAGTLCCGGCSRSIRISSFLLFRFAGCLSFGGTFDLGGVFLASSNRFFFRRNDSVALVIDGEHSHLALLESWCDEINSTVDDHDERFKRVFVERVDLGKIGEQEVDERTSGSSRTVVFGGFVDLGFGSLGDLDFDCDFSGDLLAVLQVFDECDVV
mgnify:FL=1